MNEGSRRPDLTGPEGFAHVGQDVWRGRRVRGTVGIDMSFARRRCVHDGEPTRLANERATGRSGLGADRLQRPG